MVSILGFITFMALLLTSFMPPSTLIFCMDLCTASTWTSNSIYIPIGGVAFVLQIIIDGSFSRFSLIRFDLCLADGRT
jgi:hypothetical protein